MATAEPPEEIAVFLEGLKLKSYARVLERSAARLDGEEVTTAAVAFPGLTRLVIVATRSAIVVVGEHDKHDLDIAFADIQSARKGFLETLKLTLHDGREIKFSSIQPIGRTAEIVSAIEGRLATDLPSSSAPSEKIAASDEPHVKHAKKPKAPAKPPAKIESITDQFARLSQEVLHALDEYRSALATEAAVVRRWRNWRLDQFDEAMEAEHDAWNRTCDARNTWTQPMFQLESLLNLYDEDAEAIKANTLWAAFSPGTFAVAVVSYEPNDDVWGSDQLASYLMAAGATQFEEAQTTAQRAAHVGRVSIAEGLSLDSAITLKGQLEALGCRVKIEEGASYTSSREPIPEHVRHEVWRRDGGCCVDCGSKESLEFDHIIPFSRGGSSTARNLELRCETCNRRKAARI